MLLEKRGMYLTMSFLFVPCDRSVGNAAPTAKNGPLTNMKKSVQPSRNRVQHSAGLMKMQEEGLLVVLVILTIVSGHKCQGASTYFMLEILNFNIILLGFWSAMWIRRNLSVLLIDGFRATQQLIWSGIYSLVSPFFAGGFVFFG